MIEWNFWIWKIWIWIIRWPMNFFSNFLQNFLAYKYLKHFLWKNHHSTIISFLAALFIHTNNHHFIWLCQKSSTWSSKCNSQPSLSSLQPFWPALPSLLMDNNNSNDQVRCLIYRFLNCHRLKIILIHHVRIWPVSVIVCQFHCRIH